MFRKRTRSILERHKNKEIILTSIGANFFGQESIGLKQVRGNGILILTEQEVIFEMWIPKKELFIPLSTIKKIEIAKWHLKKTKSRPLLKIHFINDKGALDSAAWLISDLEDWIQAIKSKIV